jgi:Ca-activated chloride channel family protein
LSHIDPTLSAWLAKEGQTMNAYLSLHSNIILTPRRLGLRAGQDNVVEVLVSIQAPDAPPGSAAQRPSQSLALVIDRSGSMHGQPLEEARRCALYVISQLRPTDSVSLVQFDDEVKCLWPAIPLGDGADLRQAISTLVARGNTALHGGWLAGANTLEDLAGGGLRRVVLLSDGQANAGLTDTPEIVAQCAAWAARGITTSTYGLGQNFNEDLMVAMARAGGGNHYYGETAEDHMDPFQEELELLGNLCLRELHLSASVGEGVAVERVNDLPAAVDGWRLPDLAWGAASWAVLRLRLPASTLPAVGAQHPVLRVSVQGLSAEGEPVTLERAGLALPVLSPAAFDALTDNEAVSRCLVELSAAEILSQTHEAVGRGDWERVDRLLEEASRQFAGHGWVEAMLQSIREIAAARQRDLLSKEAMYASGKLRHRLMAKDEAEFVGVAAERDGKPRYLQRKPTQGQGLK